MQEMKKRRIVLASVLKPLNDTRMMEKMAVSLAATGRYEVHVIGYPTDAPINDDRIHFHALPKFKRVSLGRVMARLKTLKITIKVKPELLIVTTHELLAVAILNRILFGASIFYDVQENYARNIRFTSAFPKGTRTLIAGLVRCKEMVSSMFVTQFILAEKGYREELAFVKNKFTIVENKCRVPAGFRRSASADPFRLVFTGTLADSTGVLESIQLAKMLHALEPKIRLHIVGYCQQPDVLRQIEKEVGDHPFITLTGGKNLVPHSLILDAIASADFGMIYYPMSPHIENKTPTKLFEYLALQLPILLQNYRPWVERCVPYAAALPVDFLHPDTHRILDQMRLTRFFSSLPEDVTWPSEEQKLLRLVDSIF
jgi:glycosyltransferase involved in cell wall biosynthesis